MSTCSVIMVSHHTGPALFAAVRSVLRQPQLSELIVVDSGNPPDVLTRLQQMTLGEPRLIVAGGAGDIGFAKACNIGATRARGDFILLLDPTCLLPPDALVETMSAFDEVPGAVLAGCLLQNPDGSEQRHSRRRLATPKTILFEALGAHPFFRSLPSMPLKTHAMEAVSSAFLCIRTKDFHKFGGLDEAFFVHGAAMDLSMRVHKAGGGIICVPRVCVTRMRTPLPPAVSEWRRARGYTYYLHKHFGRLPLLPLVWLLDALVAAACAVNVVRAEIGRHAPLPSRRRRQMAARRLMVLASGYAELPEKKDWLDKTVLVTDADDQVGLCVIRRLLAGGASVLGLSRGEGVPFRHERLRWLTGDLAGPALDLQGYLVDTVIHCAPLDYLPKMMSALTKAEVKRIVAFGSTSIFTQSLSRNRYERERVEGLSRAEMDLAAQNVPWTILRPTLIYGVGLDANVSAIDRFIGRFGFFPVYPPAFGRRQPVHADDLAMAALQAAAAPAAVNRAYNVSGGEILTYRQMVERIFKVRRRKPCIPGTTLLPFIMDMAGLLLRRPGLNGEIARRMNSDLVFFHDDAARDFGYRPRPFLSGGVKDMEGF